MNEALSLLLLALLGSVIALFGGVVFLFNRRLSNVLEKYSISFAGGVLVAVSLVGLIPEADHLIGENTYYVVLISFLAVYLFENLFFEIHHHGQGEYHKQMSLPSTIFVIVGDTLHNFIDGVAIAASFFVSPGLGFITALSTFLHEIPHEIGDFGILLSAGWKRSKILWVNIFSSLATVVGAFTIYFLGENATLNGILMSVSAGIFLYLGAVDFLPKIDTAGENKFKNLLPLVLGAGIVIATSLLIPHE